MSGDVQPRKRKDKKRRKDEAEQFSIQSTIPILTTNLASDDVNIHVHNEAGTRDGICAKLVFFVLFSALAVLICLIISEHRGMTDVDTVGSESKFSHIFEGWTDANSDNHHGHDEDESLDVDDDEEHEDRKEEEVNSSEEEEDEYIDNKALEEDERDEDTQLSEEKSDERDEELADEDDIEEDVQDSNEYQADEEEDDEVQASDEDADKQTSQEDEQEPYEYEIEEDDENNDEEEDDEDDNNVDEDDNNVDEEDQEVEDNKEDETELNDEEQEFQATGSDEDEGQDENNDIVNNKQDYDVSAENVSREDVTDDDETAQKEEVVTGDSGKDKEPDEDVQESSGMAVKLGVGVALLVVAHLVLVRKWRNAPGDKPRSEEPKDISPDLSRRNTIVVPPTFQEVEPDLEQDEEDYSDEELNEDDGRVATKSAEAKYQELRSTYSRSLSPESQPDQGKYDEEYEENIGDEEDEESSGGDEDEEDFENEEYDDDEDEQLLKRLEAKYGKIHESSKEKSGASWKSNPPNEDEDSDSDRQSDDGVGYENINITNEDDYNIKDEIDEAQKSVKNE